MRRFLDRAFLLNRLASGIAHAEDRVPTSFGTGFRRNVYVRTGVERYRYSLLKHIQDSAARTVPGRINLTWWASSSMEWTQMMIAMSVTDFAFQILNVLFLLPRIFLLQYKPLGSVKVIQIISTGSKQQKDELRVRFGGFAGLFKRGWKRWKVLSGWDTPDGLGGPVQAGYTSKPWLMSAKCQGSSSWRKRLTEQVKPDA